MGFLVFILGVAVSAIVTYLWARFLDRRAV